VGKDAASLPEAQQASALAGSVDQIVDRIGTYVEAGADQVNFFLPYPWDYEAWRSWPARSSSPPPKGRPWLGPTEVLTFAIVTGLVRARHGRALVWYFVFRDTAPSAVSNRPGERIRRGGHHDLERRRRLERWDVARQHHDRLVLELHQLVRRYRIQEQLVSIEAGPRWAGLRDISGSLVLSGSTVSNVAVKVNMAASPATTPVATKTLRDQALQTARFPSASFEAHRPDRPSRDAAAGTPISVTAGASSPSTV